MSESGMQLLEKYFSEFTAEQERQFAMLGELYHEWNEKINVISRKDIESLYEKHILHSLAIAAIFDFSQAEGLKILDVGTGGGFPGVPLAIMFPNVSFTLVDSIGKKLKVVNAVSEGIGLKNIATRHTRMEEIKGESFDFVVSRAVAPIKDLWNWSKHLINKDRKLPEFKNGMIFLKGGDLAAEISDSRLRPHMWDISTIYEEPWFQEKYILYVPA
ncbi:MAG TPA: 16S rRNA (guanine(527)-N(7))-methyltransferase RsmG [Chitinophagaceae bacterium]|nr:16S rRNA (guanine(527)-N(7))-methyltransferase RsmG [Chitinophagaceae bacterium]